MKNTSKFDEMLGDDAQLVALDEAQMVAIDGGVGPVLLFVAGIAVGYVAGKVIDGVIDGVRRPC